MIDRKQAGFTLPHILMVITVIGLVSGVGYYVYSKNDTDKTQQNRQDDSSTQIESVDSLPDDLSNIKTIEEIKTQAGTALNGATITGIELEQEDGSLVYKIKLSDGRSLFYDAKTGAVTTSSSSSSDDETDDSDDSEAIPADFKPGITIEQARTTALEQRPGKTIKKIEFETEEGVQVYSVRFTDGGRVDVSALDGSVVRTKEAKPTGSGGSDSSNNSGSSHGSGNAGSGSSGSSNSGNASDDDEDDNPSASPSSSPTQVPSGSGAGSSSDIGEAAAKNIANGRLPGRTIEEVELETEGGAKVYSVRYTDDGRVDVRATDGAILRVDE